jgi:uncharacterized membrane protein YkvA (DUF1232 family)
MGRLLKEMTVIGLGAVSLVYLANPTAGFFELIPDALPVVGNLDEAAAVVILLNTLRYYGIDPTSLWKRPDGQAERDTP